VVIRGFGRCETCDSNYMLRAGIGVENFQLHTFDCLECELPIIVAVRARAPQAHFEAEENFSLCSEIKVGYTVINLHPNFAFKKDTIHESDSFPSIEYVLKIMPYLRILEGKHQDAALQFDVPNAKNLWSTVKNILTLENKHEKEKALNKKIQNYEIQRKKYFPSTSTKKPDEVVFNFFDSLFYPRINELLEPAKHFAESVKHSDPNEYNNFISYYKHNLEEEQKNKYISSFSDYFRIHTNFSQMMVHARLNDNDVDDRIVGSKFFDEIKLYYGQVYETLTSAFVTLACLNNIKSGRKFDQFNSMTLSKYIKDVDKSKRADPFSQVPELTIFAEDLDSALRNGSHHASIWREGEKIMFRSGGTGQERDITYARYLHLCNKVTIALAAMWLLDRHIKND
jgi:hypothetical protein